MLLLSSQICIHCALYFDLTIDVIHSMWSLIISTYFFVLNLDGWETSFFNKFILFWYSIIILLYEPYLINNFQAFLAMCLSFGISVDFFLVCEAVFGSPYHVVLESLSSYNFKTALFEAVLNESLGDCFAWSRNFWLYLLLNFYLLFANIFIHTSCKRQKFIIILYWEQMCAELLNYAGIYCWQYCNGLTLL